MWEKLEVLAYRSSVSEYPRHDKIRTQHVGGYYTQVMQTSLLLAHMHTGGHGLEGSSGLSKDLELMEKKAVRTEC